jgi:ribosomal protection tetracycline resistance protein
VRTLNLGILAHVDAGKTSLTERLLYAAGVIDEIGSVDDGSTQTDSLALERQRGITIKSAVVSFLIDDVTVNLIDTPGHPDFIAEVERVLSVLDGAVLVISAVEGVQAQTRVLMRTLRRLGIPTLIFVNKIDRSGAQDAALLQSMADKLRLVGLPMGSVSGLGTRQATVQPYAGTDGPHVARLAELLAEQDESFLTRYLDDQSLPFDELGQGLVRLTQRGRTHPVFFGSAITGAGVPALTAALTELLPARVGDQNAPVAGTVFKIERGPAGEKVAYVRLFAGTVQIRDRLLFGGDREGKVTALSLFAGGAVVPATAVTAGQIAKVWGLASVRIGDSIGTAQAPEAHWFAPPTLETVVTAVHDQDRGSLHTALSQLAEQDPLINFRQDPATQQVSVSLYGEVQKEVIEATLATEFGVAVRFRETTTI